MLGHRCRLQLYGGAELSVRPGFGALFAGSFIASLATGGIRLFLHWIGSRVLGWWLFVAFEIGVVFACLAFACIASMFLGKEMATRWLWVGGALFLCSIGAHFLIVMNSSQSPAALTSILFVTALAGQAACTAGLARVLAESHWASAGA